MYLFFLATDRQQDVAKQNVRVEVPIPRLASNYLPRCLLGTSSIVVSLMAVRQLTDDASPGIDGGIQLRPRHHLRPD